VTSQTVHEDVVPDPGTIVDFTALLFDTLGYTDREFVAICHQKPGGTFRASVMPSSFAPRYSATLGDTVDVWFGVNPTRGPARPDCGRGTAEQITRLAGLWADLDVKPGACADIQTAEAIIDELSGLLGQRPAVVVFSGHGLQPHWALEDGQITDTFTTDDAAALLHRFGRLVEMVAEGHGAKVDNVFDRARVLRVPGTVNNKADPVAVTARRDTGGPLTPGEISERLTELGIYPGERDTTSAEPLSDPDGWVFARQSCPYVAKWLYEIPTDGPLPGKGRNPWACNQAVRLHCAWLLGCISETDFTGAAKLLEQRLSHLLASTEPRRRLREFEMRDAFKLGRKRASCKTEKQARAELGGHTHTPQEPPPDVDDHYAGEYNPDGDSSTVTDDAPGTGRDTEPTTWEPVDLGPYLRGEVIRPRPSLGIGRTDGQRVIYPGREHALLGETESGKTWFALGCVAAELYAGNSVVYLHFEEADPASTIDRLQLLGVDPGRIEQRLRFVGPARPAQAEWVSALLEPAPSLVVLDGVNEAMALHGADIMHAEGAAAFRRRLVTPFLRVGAATIACDHLPKEREGRSREAYGSVHKGNAIDGARILLENREPFGRRMRGRSNVFVTKDRPGHLRAHGRAAGTPGKTYLGTLVVDDMTGGPDFLMLFCAPKDDDDGDGNAAAANGRDAELAGDVYDAIAALPEHTVTSMSLLYAELRRAGRQVRDRHVRDAVADLIVTGRLVEVSGRRGAKGYRTVPTSAQESDT
jgi:hypothetical protein